MLMTVFAIYDTGISTWRVPIFARNRGEILRSWVEAVNNQKNEFCKHPSDYTLFEIGTWDDDKCKFDLHKTPISLGMAIEFLKVDTSLKPVIYNGTD